jgi:uncharacterized Fe-S cluster protein YjdI/CDGSH-type Zn-finger protein
MVANQGESSDPRGHAYPAPGVTVYYDAKRCAHFAECVRGLPDVFDVNKRPWVQPSNAAADRVAEVVRRCPTGALHYELESGASETAQRPTHVEVTPDGPLMLRGELTIEMPSGELADVRAALCRCGLTQNQPFCDRQCKRSGWSANAAGSVTAGG